MSAGLKTNPYLNEPLPNGVTRDTPVGEALNLPFEINSQKLMDDISPVLAKYPICSRSPAVGGWALQSVYGSYQEGWDYEFNPYNGPQNKGPTWMAESDFEKKLKDIQSYRIPTEVNSKMFTDLLEKLEDCGFNPRKGRIIRLSAHSESKWHVDGAAQFYQVRLHIPLITNEGCAFENSQDSIHMKPNHAYLVHVNRFHRIYNRGDQDRYHFVCNAWDQQGLSEWHKYDPMKNQGMASKPPPPSSK